MNPYKEIPNWPLFKIKFSPSRDFIDEVEKKFDALKATDSYETVAKYINVQIGILNFRERELGQDAMREFGEIFKK